MRAYAGDPTAALLLPHQLLVPHDVALLLGLEHLAMAYVAAETAVDGPNADVLLLECIIDHHAPQTTHAVASEQYVQLSAWAFDALGLQDGSTVSLQRAIPVDNDATYTSIELSVVRKHPLAVNTSSTTTTAVSTSIASTTVASSALLCLPESVRNGTIDLAHALQRQLASSGYLSVVLSHKPMTLLPLQLLHETYVFRIEHVRVAPSSAVASTLVHVRNWSTHPQTTPQPIDSTTSTLELRLAAAGFAGYDTFIRTVLLNIALVVKGTSSASIGAHGLLLTGVSGVGKSLVTRIIAAEVARVGLAVCLLDATTLAMDAERSHVATVYEFLVQIVTDAFPSFTGAAVTGSLPPSSCSGVLVIDDVDVLFAGTSDASDDSNASLSPLASAFVRLLDLLCASTQLCVVATTKSSSDASIPAAAKRTGRFEKLLEVIVPTEAMRRAILLQHLQTMPFETEKEPVSTIATRLAALTGGYVAKDLVRICRQALVLAHQRGDSVEWTDLMTAQQRVTPSQLRELNVASPGALAVGIKSTNAFVGYDALQKQLVDFITWKFQPTAAMHRLGIANASGILVYGPSGCGKSLLVRTLAAQANVNVVSVKSSELMSKYFGDSEKAVRVLFARARAAAPCILFFDEFDAIAHKRSFSTSDGGGGGGGGGDSVYARILSTFLNEMDGVGAAAAAPSSIESEPRGEILVIAATNRIDALDAALLRPGRIDKLIELEVPTVDDKLAILQHWTRKMPLASDVELLAFAQRATGDCAFTGADLAAVCKDAALRALRVDLDATTVTSEHLDAAWHNRVQSRSRSSRHVDDASSKLS